MSDDPPGKPEDDPPGKPEDDPPGKPEDDRLGKSWFQLLPRRDLRRALFLLVLLFVIIMVQRRSGGFWRSMGTLLQPPPATRSQHAPGAVRMNPLPSPSAVPREAGARAP